MRVVIKVGTSSLVNGARGTLALKTLASLVEAVARLREDGHQVILVSSGAVGCGCLRLGLRERPDSLPKKQALAAIGQTRLMRQYEDMFGALGLLCAQVLLTYDNLGDRGQFVNARNTFEELLHYGVIPIVNENDTVAVEELRIGDNDTLSAKVAALLSADWLFLLTDIDSLYTANPSKDPAARRISRVTRAAAAALSFSAQASDGVQWGSGGMGAKVRAATNASAAGTSTVIASAADPAVVVRILAGADEGTVFEAAAKRLRGRKKWIIGLPVKGRLVVDAGAERAVLRNKSLFPAGVVAVVGEFEAQEAVSIVSKRAVGAEEVEVEIARGLSSFSSKEVRSLVGARKGEVSLRLGWLGGEEVVHRATIVVMLHGSVAEDEGTGDVSEDGGEASEVGEPAAGPAATLGARTSGSSSSGAGGGSGGVGGCDGGSGSGGVSGVVSAQDGDLSRRE